jgi:hypothetical protein
VLARLARGQVQVGWQPRAIGEGSLAEQDVRAGGKAGQPLRRSGVGRVRDHTAGVLEPEAERLHWMIHQVGRDRDRPDLERARGERAELEPVRQGLAGIGALPGRAGPIPVGP